MGLWVMILKSNSREWWDLEDGGDQWVFKVEISGFVGSNLWVCKSVSGFDFKAQGFHSPSGRSPNTSAG